jgi:hypothetical protein
VRLFPRRARGDVDGAGRAGWATVVTYARTQLLVATIDAIGIGLGAFLLGVPLAIPIGVLVFLGAFVPFVGAIVTGTLAVFLALVYNGPWIALWMVVVVLGVQQLEGTCSSLSSWGRPSRCTRSLSFSWSPAARSPASPAHCSPCRWRPSSTSSRSTSPPVTRAAHRPGRATSTTEISSGAPFRAAGGPRVTTPTEPTTAAYASALSAIPSLAEFEDAAAVLRDVVVRTPFDVSEHLSDVLGAPVHLKLENLQRTGSFKIRGATYRLSPHRRGARAGRRRGIGRQSRSGRRARGAEARHPGHDLHAARGPRAQAPRDAGLWSGGDPGGRDRRDSAAAGGRVRRAHRRRAHPAFDHRDIIIGQGTLGLELWDAVDDLDTVVLGIGGGGLIAGVAAAVKARAAARAHRPRHRRAGGELRRLPSSLAAGEPLTVATTPTIADGIAVARPGDARSTSSASSSTRSSP